MLSAALEVSGMQPVALLLLTLYLAAAAILAPREFSFLAKVEQPYKRLFITQDILLSVSILGVLLPAALIGSNTGTRQAIYLFTVIGVAFTLLWIVAVWMAVARQRYVLKLLQDSTRDSQAQIARIAEQLKQAQTKETDDA